VDLKEFGSVNAGQNLTQNLSSSFKVTETHRHHLESNDFSDSLTGFSAGLTTSIIKKFDFESGNSWTPTRASRFESPC